MPSLVALVDGFALHRLAGRSGPEHVEALNTGVVTLFEAFVAQAAGQSCGHP